MSVSAISILIKDWFFFFLSSQYIITLTNLRHLLIDMDIYVYIYKIELRIIIIFDSSRQILRELKKTK